jgi:hypothetical protein
MMKLNMNIMNKINKISNNNNNRIRLNNEYKQNELKWKIMIKLKSLK